LKFVGVISLDGERECVAPGVDADAVSPDEGGTNGSMYRSLRALEAFVSQSFQ
jgi:hypothetical protein